MSQSYLRAPNVFDPGSLQLSIIVPVYNAEKYLRDCLHSLRNQTRGNFEVIVVNDGSSDDSLEIAQEFASHDSRFSVLSGPNGGVSQARNIGLGEASGTYVAFVDADDWLQPNLFEDLLAPTDRHLYDAVAGDLTIESSGGRQKTEQAKIGGGEYDADRIAREIWPILISSDRLTREWPFRIVTKLFRREHLIENDVWFVPGLRAAQDFVFSVSAMLAAESFYYAQGASGYHYRWNPQSRTRSRLASAWANYRGVDQALQVAVSDRAGFAVQLSLAELHGDLSALTYTYKDCRLGDSRELFRNLTDDLGGVDREQAFQALDWGRMPLGKRVICELMRRRRYRLMHVLLLIRGLAPNLRSRLLQGRAK